MEVRNVRKIRCAETHLPLLRRLSNIFGRCAIENLASNRRKLTLPLTRRWYVTATVDASVSLKGLVRRSLFPFGDERRSSYPERHRAAVQRQGVSGTSWKASEDSFEYQTPCLALVNRQRKSIADAQGRGVKLVLNLAMPDSDFALPDERAVVELLGMDFIHIPVPFSAPTIEHFLQFERELVLRYDPMILVHCAYNWRASSFVALYAVSAAAAGPASRLTH